MRTMTFDDGDDGASEIGIDVAKTRKDVVGQRDGDRARRAVVLSRPAWPWSRGGERRNATHCIAEVVNFYGIIVRWQRFY